MTYVVPTPLTPPSYAAAQAAGIAVGATVSVTFSRVVLYKVWPIHRDMTLVSMNQYTFTIQNSVGTRGTYPWSQFNGYYPVVPTS